MSELEDPVAEAPDIGVDEPEVDSGADEPRTYAGKYASPDDLEKAYLESQQLHTRSSQEAAELREQIAQYEAAQQEPEQPFDPYAAIGGQLDEQSGQAWANRLYRDPAATMADALRPESIQAFGPDLADRLYVTWFGLQPLQAQMWAAQHGAASQRQEVEQLRADWQQEHAERFAQQHQTEAAAATRWASENLPDWNSHRGKVAELYGKYTMGDDDPRIQTHEAMKDYIEELYARAIWENLKENGGAAGQEPTPANPAAAKARTSTRSSASGTTRTVDPATQALLDAHAASK